MGEMGSGDSIFDSIKRYYSVGSDCEWYVP